MSRLIKYGAPLAYAAYKAAGYGVGDAIRGGARSFARSAAKKVRSMVRRKRNSGSYKLRAAVTQQHDVRSNGSYRPRSGRKWSRFRAKVRAAIQADNPRHLYQAVYKSSGTATDSIAGFDGVYFLDLNTTSQGDIWNIFKDLGAATAADTDNYKAYITSATMDFMITNTDTTNACEVDIYECVARRDDTQTSTPGTVWSTYFADMDATGTVTSQHPGLTPFQVPNFIRAWKVTKSTKYLIDAGKTISMQLRSKINRVIGGARMASSVSIQKGLTRMVFFRVRGIAKNVAATGLNPASGLSGWSCSWSGVTSINYQALPTPDQTEDVDQSK